MSKANKDDERSLEPWSMPSLFDKLDSLKKTTIVTRKSLMEGNSKSPFLSPKEGFVNQIWESSLCLPDTNSIATTILANSSKSICVETSGKVKTHKASFRHQLQINEGAALRYASKNYVNEEMNNNKPNWKKLEEKSFYVDHLHSTLQSHVFTYTIFKVD